MKKLKKKSNSKEIDSYDKDLMQEIKRILESSGMPVIPAKDIPGQTTRYEVTFWRKNKK